MLRVQTGDDESLLVVSRLVLPIALEESFGFLCAGKARSFSKRALVDE
jgi:hypothetical protein